MDGSDVVCDGVVVGDERVGDKFNASGVANDSVSGGEVFVAEEIGEDGDLVFRIVDNEEAGDKEAEPIPVLQLYKGMEFSSGVEFVAHVHRYGQSLGFGVKIRDSQKDTRAKVAAQVAEDEKLSELARWYNLDDKYKHYIRIRMWCRKGGKFGSRSCDPNRSTTSCRCECPFLVTAWRSPINGTVWRITNFLDAHNHNLHPELSRYLPRYRRISIQDQTVAKQLHKASVGVAKMYDVFVNKYKGYEHVPFSEKYLRNFIYFVNRKPLKDSDFGKMEIHFQKMRELSPDFFYEFHVDEVDYTLKNVFWADSRCRDAFQEFGDVVSFDTTFVTNRYKMPLAPFVGVNHHGKTMLFGCALIAKEDAESFAWVFRTFRKCMGKEPGCILTDQDRAIGSAIRTVYPGIKHRWCIWHVMRNCRKHLGMRSGWGEIVKKLQNVLHDSFSIEEFESGWQGWVEKFGLGSNSWVIDMYRDRSKWAPIFFKNSFWAGMSSTQRSEGNNHYLKCFVDINTCLADFVEKYGKAVCRRIEEEDKCTVLAVDLTSRCTSNHAFEEVYEKMYTRGKYLELHDELKQFGKTKGTIVRVDLPIVEYDVLVKEFRVGWTKRANFRVIMDRSTLEVKCDCMHFEFTGILCVHMLRVFWEEDSLEVPEKYICRRWCKNIPRKYQADSYPMQALYGFVAPEVKRFQEFNKVAEEIGVMVMSNEEMQKEAVARMKLLKNEINERFGNGMHEGLTSHVIGGVGRVYRSLANARAESRRSEAELDGEGEVNGVKDPVDKRGRGRGPHKRKVSCLDQLGTGRGRRRGSGRGRGRKGVGADGIGNSPGTATPASTPTKDVQSPFGRGWNVLRQGYEITGGSGKISLAQKHPFGLF